MDDLEKRIAETLKKITHNGVGYSFSNLNSGDMIIIVDSLERGIAKKPIYSNFENNGDDEVIPTEAKCPVCGEEFEFSAWNDEENHHCICGQRIDWSEYKIEEKHGSWIPITGYWVPSNEQLYRCSSCTEFITDGYIDVCPRCGAIMDEYDEDEEE